MRAVLSLYEAAPFDAASGRAVLANFVPNGDELLICWGAGTATVMSC